MEVGWIKIKKGRNAKNRIKTTGREGGPYVCVSTNVHQLSKKKRTKHSDNKICCFEYSITIVNVNAIFGIANARSHGRVSTRSMRYLCTYIYLSIHPYLFIICHFYLFVGCLAGWLDSSTWLIASYREGKKSNLYLRKVVCDAINSRHNFPFVGYHQQSGRKRETDKDAMAEQPRFLLLLRLFCFVTRCVSLTE